MPVVNKHSCSNARARDLGDVHSKNSLPVVGLSVVDNILCNTFKEEVEAKSPYLYHDYITKSGFDMKFYSLSCTCSITCFNGHASENTSTSVITVDMDFARVSNSRFHVDGTVPGS